MKESEAAEILRVLAAGFHRESIEPETIQLWVEVIAPMDAEMAFDVAMKWIKNQDSFPSISQFRHAYHSARRSADPHRLSAAYEVPADLGLSTPTTPSWVMRWLNRYRAVSAVGGPRERAKFDDWRVFPEQVTDGNLRDDPRYSRAEAEELGLMPEDAWCA